MISNFPISLLQYAELEAFVGDVERARGIYKLSVGTPYMDQPDVLWKSYINFEISHPQDKASTPNLKLLQMAKAWKKQAEGNDE